MPETWVQALTHEDATYATEPLSLCTETTEPVLQSQEPHPLRLYATITEAHVP